MSSLLEYLQTAVSGWREFVTVYKGMPLVIGILLYVIISKKGKRNTSVDCFLKYVILVGILLMLPITAVFFLAYQTRFYDYGWIWSYVPLAVVTAWGVVVVVWEEIPRHVSGWKEKRKQYSIYMSLLIAVGVLWISGNQGQRQTLSEEIVQQQAVSSAILEYLQEDVEMEAPSVVWGPKNMMQYLRSRSGDILLYYGKDMWDEKSGAYDYEPYSSDEIAAYKWMELLCDERNLYLLETNQASEYFHEALAQEKFISDALDKGVNCMIFPQQMEPWVERKIEKAASERDMNITSAMVDKWMLWILETEK